ncbi:hypothetical protein Hanom_Chr12g01130991 [Helianthus anomalus]
MGKEAYMSIRLQHDKRTRTLKWVVNKVSFAATENVEPNSSGLDDAIKRPHPTMPAQKANTRNEAKQKLEFHGKPTQTKANLFVTILTLNSFLLALYSTNDNSKHVFGCRPRSTVQKAWQRNPHGLKSS